MAFIYHAKAEGAGISFQELIEHLSGWSAGFESLYTTAEGNVMLRTTNELSQENMDHLSLEFIEEKQ
jgi:hypothetical protein